MDFFYIFSHRPKFLHYSTKLRAGNVFTDICLSTGVSLVHVLCRGIGNSDTRSLLGGVCPGVSMSMVWLPSPQDIGPRGGYVQGCGDPPLDGRIGLE